MPDFDALARVTCSEFLTAADLKEVCRRRGLAAPSGGGRAALDAWLAPRFLETAGVQEAGRSLDEAGLLLLHLIALAPQPLCVRDLWPLLGSGDYAETGNEYRSAFRRAVEAVANRGLVLIEDTNLPRYNGESRFARLAFHLPPAFRPLLPPFPVPAEPLGPVGPEPGACDIVAFCRAALRASIGRPEGAPREPGGSSDGLLDRLAALFSICEHALLFDGKPAATPETLLGRVGDAWVAHGSLPRKRERSVAPPFVAALHVLSSLPAGHGCTVSALAAALERLHSPAPEKSLAAWCAEGHSAGFLLRGGPPADPRYAARPPAESLSLDAPLVCAPDGDGLRIDLERTGVGPLFALAGLSKATADPTAGLRLAPDPIALGRAWPAAADLPALAAARAASPAYEAAARRAAERHGKLRLHEGLALFRLDDLGLRALLGRRLGARGRALDGPYVAVARCDLDAAEGLLREKGFSLRRLS
ncbi:MAG: hypothetical protein HYZ53_05600 [Planctomycetes bacterium]|nr:hypothetical protein [Planctomycetota bacterium]